METIDYDQIADAYDERYKRAYRPDGIASKLLNLAEAIGAGKILEVACGTGHWLEILSAKALVYGMDLSFGMLQKATERKSVFFLINGDVGSFPFPTNCFDMVCCINALHHFDDPCGFIKSAHQLLRHNGALAVIGMNPHSGRDQWFVYDYFPGTHETDVKRYPAPGTIVNWMISAGFDNIHWQVGERIVDHRRGNDVLPLSKDFTSQLTLLTAEEYTNGIARIKSTLREAKAIGQTPTFPVDISLAMITGRV